jgi:hypothetical protein
MHWFRRESTFVPTCRSEQAAAVHAALCAAAAGRQPGGQDVAQGLVRPCSGSEEEAVGRAQGGWLATINKPAYPKYRWPTHPKILYPLTPQTQVDYAAMVQAQVKMGRGAGTRSCGWVDSLP